ncbi:hypothetical protein MNB_SV-3-169 [hydrothermal vent metagenome]|uniref:Exosortase/archaeosortase family protein n=1 Tax=hydrothermal vent metagenome TaxID=652676 RepID=A0A1W1BRS6_9ZZZZ
MKQFVVRYFIFLGGLFALFYLPTSVISVMLNEEQTRLTLFLLDFFLKPEQLQGIDIWINPHYKIFITKACNGMIPILFLFASVLAYYGTWKYKILWMFLGYIIFSIVNVIRILFVVYIVQTGEGYADFHWSHDILGNILLLFTGMLLFIGFIKTSTKSVRGF